MSPAGWRYDRFKTFAVLQRGVDLVDSELKPGSYPVVKSNGIDGWHECYQAKGPGVTTGRSGTIGNAFYIEHDFWPHNTCLYVKDFRGNNPKYIYYLISSMNFERFSAGTSVPTLNRNDIHAIKVSVPDTPEQQRIADLLTLTDDVIAATQASIAAAQKLKRGLMQSLLTGKLKPDGSWRSDDEFDIDPKFGRVPKGWSLIKGKMLFRLHGSTASQDSRGEPLSKTCLFMKVEDFNIPANDPFIVETDDTFDAPSSKPVYPCKPGWLVVAKRGAAISHNRVRMLARETILDPNLMAIEMLGGHSPEYFRYFLLHKRLERFTEVSSIPQLNNKDLYPRSFIMPPPEEQPEILRAIESVEDVIQHRLKKQSSLRKLKASLMQNLLTGKVRVPPDLKIE